MHLTITHSTTYRFGSPVTYGLQELRLHPRTRPGQTVLDWQTRIDGGSREVMFDDQYANIVELVRLAPDTTEVTVTANGTVETEDTGGIVPRHIGYAPLWLFLRSTALTEAGDGISGLTDGLRAAVADDVELLHTLCARILDAVAYESGRTDVGSNAEDVLAAGHGVCQDHAHVFITASRALGFPARYVSGYLTMDGVVEQDASHAWGEAWVEGLGWVGFDAANGISPDERYVRVATGLDYGDAAPVSGLRFGAGDETLQVEVQVQQ